jgi:hypothetical protein
MIMVISGSGLPKGTESIIIRQRRDSMDFFTEKQGMTTGLFLDDRPKPEN